MDQSNSKREVQIINDLVKKQYNIQDSDVGKNLEENKIQLNFIKHTQQKENEMTKSETELDTFIDYQNQKLMILKDNQNKIYNKLLWINITSDQIHKEQKEHDLLKNTQKLSTVKDLQIQTNKVKGYSQNLKQRLDNLEESLDQYFYEFLKINKEKLTSLENNQFIKK